MSTPSRPTRRETLAGLCGGAAVGLVGGPALASARPPNVVFVLVDDLRWNWLGCMGHPWIPTPHIDRLAAGGTIFDNTFVAVSLCSPSRATMLTGCQPQRTRVFKNSSQHIATDVPSWAQVLQGGGYETACFGKWHMRPYNRPKPGWDHWLSFRGQGLYNDPELYDGEKFFTEPGYITDLLTHRTVAWLQGRTSDKPFALLLSHKGVHGRPVPAARHAAAFPTEQFPEPVSWTDDLADKPEYQRAGVAWGRTRHAWAKRRDAGVPIPASIPPRPWQPRHPIHMDTARCLLSVDESVGRVCDTLDQLGLAQDTVVIFTSDNGVLLGEHAFLPGGKQLLYEESVRVPLILRGPGVPVGRRDARLVSGVDLAPTLFELGGIAEPPPVHGRSLVPLLARKGRGRVRDWRKHLLLQHFADVKWPARPTMHGLRTDRYKLVVSPAYDDGLELYDLDDDPYELHNLAVSGGHEDRIAELRQQLDQKLTALGPGPEEPVPSPAG